MQAAVRDAPSFALQLWEAYHSSSALAGTLRGAVRAHQECANLAQLLDTVSELLRFVFSRFNDALFLGSLNTHVASAAQLLHFGLLKVCRVADSCCSNSRINSAAPFSPSTTTSSAASAAADIQLAVTVLATAVQYLETTHNVKQSDAAAPQVLPGPRASLQLQQQALLQSSKDTAAAYVSARRSTGSARQLSGQLEAVQLFNTSADADTAGLAGNCYSNRGSTTSPSAQYKKQHHSELADVEQPAVAGELTFNAQWPLDVPADSTAPQQEEEEQQEQQEEKHAITPSPPQSLTAAAESINPEAYQAAKLQALQELLLPGSTWSLENGGAGFVCKPSRSSSPQHQRQPLTYSSPVNSHGLLAALQTGQLHARTGVEATAEAVAEDSDAADIILSAPLATADCEQAPDTQLSGTLSGEHHAGATGMKLQPGPCTAEDCAGCDDAAEQLLQEVSLQDKGLQETDAPVSSAAWLQQQLQQIYSNALLQGRKPQQQRHSILRRSQELMCSVIDAAELPLLRARAQSPEPAGFGLGFVSAGFSSGSGSGGRSGRVSTEDLVEAVLGRRAQTTGGGTSSSASGSIHGSSKAAAAAAGVLTLLSLDEPASKAAGAGRACPSPNRGRRSPVSSAPGSIRMSVDVKAAGDDSKGCSGSGNSPGMIGTCSPRGYAGRSHASRAASVSGSVRSSGAGSSQRRSASSSPGSAARAASYAGSGRVTPVRPARSTAAAAASANSRAAAPGSGRVTPARSGRASASGPAVAPGSSAAGQGGSSSGTAAGSTSRRASSSPEQSSVRASREWQGVNSTPAGTVCIRSPSRTGSSSPVRQSQSGMRVSMDSIQSSRRSSTPRDGGSGDGAGSNAYAESLAAAASAAGTAYKSANSSGSGSITGSGRLTRRSSTGSTTLFMSARSSQAGSTAGSVAGCHEGTAGRMRTSSNGSAGTCSVTSAAAVSVLGMLAAAAAGAAGSKRICSQGDIWLQLPAAMQQQQLAGSLPGTPMSRAGSTTSSCSGMVGRLLFVPAAIAESVRVSRCSTTGVAASGSSRQVSGDLAVLQQQDAAGCGQHGSSAGGHTSGRVSACSPTAEPEVSNTTGLQAAEGAEIHLEQQEQHQEVLDFPAASRQDTKQGGVWRGSSAGGCTSSRISACSPTGEPEVSESAEMHEEQQQQQLQEAVDCPAAAMQDTKQAWKSAAAAPLAAASAAADALAATHMLMFSASEQQQRQQRGVLQHTGDNRQECNSASADAATADIAQNAGADMDTWQQRQKQWQQQRQQQQCAAAAGNDGFGDFQGLARADSAGACFDVSTAAAAADPADTNENPAPATTAVGDGGDGSSLIVSSTATQLLLEPSTAPPALLDAAAAAATAGMSASTADASPAAPATTPEAAAEALLADGNAAYTVGKYSPAVQCYAKALDSLGGSIAHTTSQVGVLLWIKCSLNLACCHLRLGQFKQCVALCDSLLEVDPANIVALCHRGRALLMVQQHAAAKADLTAALELLEEEAASSKEAAGNDDGASDAVLGPLQAADGRAAAAAAGCAVRPSSRCLSPCTLARMRLNNGYWQQRVFGLLASIEDS